MRDSSLLWLEQVGTVTADGSLEGRWDCSHVRVIH
jgi:hypothetical protein